MRIERIGTHNLVRKECEICAGVFHVRKYRATRARFCSQQCGGVWHAKTRLATAPRAYMLGNQLRKGVPPVNKGKPGPKGPESASWKPRVALPCENCGQEFSRPPWVQRQNNSRFCSRECFARSGIFQGEKSRCWVGGPRTYRGRGWLTARAGVVRDQNGRCARCKVFVGHSLPVHHIRPFRLFATAYEANVRSNLIGLCQACHMVTEAESSESGQRRIEQAHRQKDLFVHQPAAAPQAARVADLFAEGA